MWASAPRFLRRPKENPISMRQHVIPSTPSAPDTERRRAERPDFADTQPDFAPALDDDGELEDTQPSIGLPPLADEAFYDSPTLPGIQLHPVAAGDHEGSPGPVRDGQWDRVLAAVALAVRRVFTSHSS
jgi:hypothetical protein